MLGKRSPQRGLFEADQLSLDFVGRESFYGFLAGQRGRLFADEEFAALYTLDNGRPSVPPSLLATALLLQTHDRPAPPSTCAGRSPWGSGSTSAPSPRAPSSCSGPN
jgi:hypothetical protein